MRRAWFAVLATVVLVGCGSKAVIPVNGIVTMDGVPLDGAAVTFFPDGKAATLGGMARTGSDGKFVITGAKGEAGLVPGSYKVTVSK
ncbi:MAG: carboxypeptidase regulatory-like domain-containing protein, partial [Gemmataceae bacterium]|nr:carboxypeptidase regulatory-like domain-containing protein [Gemmataceae bacterium]